MYEMYEKLLNSNSLNDFYENLFTLWKGIDYVGISNKYLLFRYIDKTCIINKKLGFIDIDNINEPIFIKSSDLRPSYVKLFFRKKKFILEVNKIKWFVNFSVQETLINNNNNILIDLYDFIKKDICLTDYKYISILLLNEKIDKDELMAKIYNIRNDKYNLEKFIKALYRYRENELILNKCIENYNNVDMINNIYKKWLLIDRIKK